MEIIKQGTIKDSSDLLNLNIIDWNRLNGAWGGTGDAVKTITSWFAGHAIYTIFKCDLKAAPQRSDWPGWNHVGNHEPLGRMYWNDFYCNYKGKLEFGDQPDFMGELYDDKFGITSHFFGDIGCVSASTFAHMQKRLGPHDLWISVLSSTRQVTIEPMIDIRAMVAYNITGDDRELEDAEKHARECPYCHTQVNKKDLTQLTLF